MPKFKAVTHNPNGVRVNIHNVTATNPREAWRITARCLVSCKFFDLGRFWKEGGYLIEDEAGTIYQPVKPV